MTIPAWCALLIALCWLAGPTGGDKLDWWLWQRDHGLRARYAHIKRRDRLKRQL